MTNKHFFLPVLIQTSDRKKKEASAPGAERKADPWSPGQEARRDRFAERFWRALRPGGEAKELDRAARAKPGGLVK